MPWLPRPILDRCHVLCACGDEGGRLGAGPAAHAQLALEAVLKGVEAAGAGEDDGVLGAAGHRGHGAHLRGHRHHLRHQVRLARRVHQGLRDGGEGGGVELLLDSYAAPIILRRLPQAPLHLLLLLPPLLGLPGGLALLLPLLRLEPEHLGVAAPDDEPAGGEPGDAVEVSGGEEGAGAGQGHLHRQHRLAGPPVPSWPKRP